MIETIEHNGRVYPALQAAGFAAKFAFPFAKEIISGEGIDCGPNRKEWGFIDKNGVPAILVDPSIDPMFDAMNLPVGKYDYIISSHMIEHYIGRFQEVIEYWLTKLRKGGVIFLYLPNCEYQTYWAWGNKKHIHYLSPKIMAEYCATLDIQKFFVTEGYDLNGSFYCIIEK
jgi:SAM-dependent methyltransferase